MRPTQSEVLLLIFIVAIVGAIGAALMWPRLTAITDARAAARENALECLKNMISIVEGDQDSRVCPRSLDSYDVEKREGGDVLSCPSPENHLSHHPQFTRNGDRWAFNLELPDLTAQPREPVRVYSATLHVTPERALIQVKEEGASRFVLPPLFIILGVFLCLLAVPFCFAGFEWVKCWIPEATLVGKFIIIVVGVLGTTIVAAVNLAMGLGVIWIAHKGLAESREIVISQTSKDVVIQDFYFGKPWKEPVRITNVKTFYPFDQAGQTQVIVIYQNQEELGHQFLFTVGTGQAGVVSILQQALFGAQPSWEGS